MRGTLRYLRHERDDLNATSRAAGFPVDDTPRHVVLWRTVRSLPEIIRQHEALVVGVQQRFDEADPFLRVARRDAPPPYDWRGAATVRFPGRSLQGILATRWDGSRVSGTFEYDDSVQPGAVGFQSSPGRLRGPDSVGRADFPNAMLEGISGEFTAFGGATTSSFIARRLTVTERAGDSIFHRYCFRGGRFRGWGVTTERISSRTAKRFRFETRRDSFETRFFDRRARITQVHDDEADQDAQVIGVTVAGEPLDEREERLVWLVLSFVVGTRVQPISVERFDDAATRTEVAMLGAVDYGDRATAPPFDLRIAQPTFAVPDFTRLADAFGALEDDGYPIAEALHHLHDANNGYTQVELKNLLFCIHTLFEFWSDKFGQRQIIKDSAHDRLRKQVSTELDRVFGVGTEIRESVQSAVRNANDRVGAQLQEVFFDSLGVVLSDPDLRALRRRNSLFHNGYLVPAKDQSQLAFYQELYDDGATLRTLAHIAVLKLADYSGTVFDYRTWTTIVVASGYPEP